MSLHPDADAFVRAILGNPADVTARLAFADWLEEQGGVPNLAWAYYVRLHVEIANRLARGRPCRLLRQEAEGHASYIQATVTLHAAEFTRHRISALQVLPPTRYSVTLDDYDIPVEARECMPRPYVRATLALPLFARGQLLIVASPGMSATTRLIRSLALRLGKRIVQVHADLDQIRTAIAHLHSRDDQDLDDNESHNPATLS